MEARLPFVYVLHSGNLYGTERMALATLHGLRDEFDPVLFAPPGPALQEALRSNMNAVSFRSTRDLSLRLRPWLAAHERLVFAATGVIHSAAFIAWNALYRRSVRHLHLVHGGPNERDSYGRKRVLNRADVRFVAVSEYARSRLVAHGVRASRVSVLPNFLLDEQIALAPRRPAFTRPGIRDVVIVARADPSKRLDVLLDALELAPTLSALRIRVLGGRAHDALVERAARDHPNVTFEGFCADVPEQLAKSDLLLHTCPTEAFCIAVLEAMAAGIPVLVPDQGGTAALIEDCVSGRLFRANDPASLAGALSALQAAPCASLNGLVAAADQRLASRYSSATCLRAYRELLSMPVQVSCVAQRASSSAAPATRRLPLARS